MVVFVDDELEDSLSLAFSAYPSFDVDVDVVEFVDEDVVFYDPAVLESPPCSFDPDYAVVFVVVYDPLD